MNKNPIIENKQSNRHPNRIGFHYYPDTLHYRQSDLQTWLPELKALNTGWLVLQAPTDRAIPEYFIQGLLAAGIEPVLHFPFLPEATPAPNELALLFKSYANWGVRYLALFDRPNTHKQWGQAAWAQQDLVERFLDLFIPLAEKACSFGLTPLFPPLEPGGDYWDTAFLRAALQSIQRRGHQRLLDRLALSAYAWADNRPFDWGAGGPERWPGARPYFTPPEEQDQLGFRIFDWYNAIAQAVLDQPLPILLLATGSRPGDHRATDQATVDAVEHTTRNLQIAQLLAGETNSIPDGVQLEPIPDHVIAGCFWLLTTAPNDPNQTAAWFQEDDETLPIVQKMQAWANTHEPMQSTPETTAKGIASTPNTVRPVNDTHPIQHYLLLPRYEWGISDWHLEVIQPFIKRHQPTVGFSPAEAALAEQVTVIGGDQSFSELIIEQLKSAGCIVHQISGDGTTIATILETL